MFRRRTEWGNFAQIHPLPLPPLLKKAIYNQQAVSDLARQPAGN